MPRLLHLGLGNFHRAHQAIYTLRANQATGSNWQITGVSFRSASMRDMLAAQGFDYTLVTRAETGSDYARIGIIEDCLVAPENPEGVVGAIADPETSVITLTITEKGYAPGSPAIALLADGLAERAQSGAPVTIVSCDNLSGNGRVLEGAVRARAQGQDIERYLETKTAFPNSMVDRIVPATTDALRREVAQKTGWPDHAPVATEAFSEWVLQDRFAAQIPDWAAAGALIVPSVEPFELRKLRLLNGAHSALAYGGLQAGHTFVHEAIADGHLHGRIAGLMEEAVATLPLQMTEGCDTYRRALMQRFANPAMEHRLDQIAQDGSQKLPMRLLPVRAERAARGLVSPNVDWALRSWCDHVADCHARRVTLHDPMAKRLYGALDAGRPVASLLDLLG